MQWIERISGRGWLHRTGCTALLLAQILFLVVVMPGHTRGAITLSGKATVGEHELMFDGCCGGHERPRDEGGPAPLDRSDCAVCTIAIALTAAVVLLIVLDSLGLAGIVRVVADERGGSLSVVQAYFGRAPPAV